jgi:methylated-DNA-[protein]-cysteine S-methyltransferase
MKSAAASEAGLAGPRLRQSRQNGVVRELSWTTIETPAGPLSAGCSDAGLAAVRFGGRPAQEPGSRPDGSADRPDNDTPGNDTQDQVLAATCAQLAEYFAGHRRTFELPIDWAGVSPLQHQVLSVLFDSVGYGETITYGGLARRAGVGTDVTELPARAIGRIMGSNPVPVIVPCHRVVAGNGLGGFSGGIGPELKRWLLIFEGALPPTLDWTPAGLPE